MLAVRSFARSAPRTLARLSSSTVRRPAARHASLLQSAWKSSGTQQCAAAFSTSAARRSSPAAGDTELAAKLGSELQIENEIKDENGVPSSVQDYLENGPFEIIDTPGEEEVVMKRKFGDEQIRITFSIADLNNFDPDADFRDPAMADEVDENTKSSPEDQAEDGQEGAEEQDQSFPVRLNIIIDKANKGSLAVEAVIQGGMVVIDNVYYYADSSLAHGKTADKVHARQDLYVGPPFGNLDEDLQVLLERYLDERGINAALAIFVPDYVDMKEQKEYVRWLESVKGFVEA